MPENLLQTAQQLIQDVIAPDVRELKVKLEALEKQMGLRFDAIEARFDFRFAAVDSRFDSIDTRFKAVDTRFDAMMSEIKSDRAIRDAQYNTLLSLLGELTAKADAATSRQVSDLAQRVSVIETILSQRQHDPSRQIG